MQSRKIRPMTKRKKQSIETNSKMNQVLELADMDFKQLIHTWIQRKITTISERMKTLNKETETIKDRNSRPQKFSIWKEKSTLKRRLETAEESCGRLHFSRRTASSISHSSPFNLTLTLLPSTGKVYCSSP